MAAVVGDAVLGIVLTNVIQVLRDKIAKNTRFLTSYKSIAEEYCQGKESIESILQRVRDDVTRANENVEVVDKEIEQWLKDVEKQLQDLQNVEMELKEMKNGTSCFGSNNIYRKYSLAKKAAKKTEMMAKLREDAKFVRVARREAVTGKDFLSCEDYDPFKSTEIALNQAIEALKGENNRLVGIYGMGGVGKTTLVKKVGLTVMEKDPKLFDKVVMAVVSQNPNVRKIQDELAEQLGLTMDKETESGRASLLKVRLQKEKKVLLILDDVWAGLNLGAIGIPVGGEHTGCKVVITTRSEDVCNNMQCHSKIPLDVLSVDDAWKLMGKNACIDTDVANNLNNVAYEVTKECKGLPLAVVTVGRAMRDKTLNEWKIALKQLQRSTPVGIKGVDTDVYASIKLSYDYLNHKEAKLCFLICSLFPEDHAIHVEELCLYAIGLELYEDEAKIDQARRNIQGVIQNLKASGLLLHTGREDVVKMHDVVRDVALWIASKGDRTFNVQAGLDLDRWPAFRSVRNYIAISLLANKLRDLPDDRLKYPKLKMLLLGKNEDNIEVPDRFFEGKDGLNVLDLTYSSRRWDLPLKLPNSLQFLTSLRGLYLRHCKLDDISILGKLKELEILSIRDCYLVRFPNEIGELDKLMLLDLSKCEVGSVCAKAIGRLLSLQELYLGGTTFKHWEVEGTSASGSNAWLSELNLLYYLSIFSVNLENLRCIPEGFAFNKLSRYDISMNNSSKEYPSARTLDLKDLDAHSLEAFKNLLPTVEYLTIQCLADGIQNLIPSMDPRGFNKLLSLKLQSCCAVQCLVDTLPDGSRNGSRTILQNVFSNLVELYLHNMDGLSSMCSGPVPKEFLHKLRVLNLRQSNRLPILVPSQVMEKTRNLEKVSVEECQQVQVVFQIEGSEDQLTELQILKLKNLPRLRYIWNGTNHRLICLRNLTSLKVTYCNKLIYIFLPSFAGNAQQLKYLTIKGCEDLEKIIHEDEEDEIISEVYEYFPKLETLRVEECNKLKTLFPVKAPKGLPSLRSLRVTNASELENIFGVAVENGIEKKIVFPELKEVQLKQLPKLTGFTTGDHHFQLPSLSKLIVKKCTQRINTCFSLSSDLTVHVKQNLATQVDIGGLTVENVTWDRSLNPQELPTFMGITNI